jgi:hypothetical protein
VDQVSGCGIEQVKEWYVGFSVVVSACVECGVCEERWSFGVEIIAKMHQAIALYES